MKLTTKRPIALATLCLLISAAISTPNAFSYTTDSHRPASGRLPATKPLESLARLAR